MNINYPELNFHNSQLWATKDELIELLGEPRCIPSFEGSTKIKMEWDYQIKENGNVVIIYGWQEFYAIFERIPWNMHIIGEIDPENISINTTLAYCEINNLFKLK